MRLFFVSVRLICENQRELLIKFRKCAIIKKNPQAGFAMFDFITAWFLPVELMQPTLHRLRSL